MNSEYQPQNYVPGAVDRTGGICPFDRKLRNWDSFAGDILVTGETCVN